MYTVTSRDGTTIAFERSGDGPPIVFVTGAFNDRYTCAPLAGLLASRFTVITYDRRGRGDSGDAAPYAVQREIEDLDAVIEEAGGAAFVFGYSSGAVLALKAAAHGSAITKLAVYEPPVPLGHTGPSLDLAAEIAELVSAGRRGDAVEAFQTRAVGLPAEVVAQIRTSPMWPGLEKMAHTLVHDLTITGDPALTEELGSVKIPTLVLDGAVTWDSVRQAATAIAAALPRGDRRTLPGGENHHIDPAATAPVLGEFFTVDPV
ncbi:alpha/beta hydrolase [Planotetraspora sp. A-T 1434]|uniref:alpha/beta fold hydrolase n=1 Tax=Planotetraspora sp. A-T 1434 TaxID=2979219 RepID=UPI0021BF2986|nr:alpha/beta hydrolase [Planotetraspora sp. A-T 1434]MCT9931836.1 alpha/beta hydrolase [Planotetraspora sp. A-T 1434]